MARKLDFRCQPFILKKVTIPGSSGSYGSSRLNRKMKNFAIPHLFVKGSGEIRITAGGTFFIYLPNLEEWLRMFAQDLINPLARFILKDPRLKT